MVVPKSARPQVDAQFIIQGAIRSMYTESSFFPARNTPLEHMASLKYEGLDGYRGTRNQSRLGEITQSLSIIAGYADANSYELPSSPNTSELSPATTRHGRVPGRMLTLLQLTTSWSTESA